MGDRRNDDTADRRDEPPRPDPPPGPYPGALDERLLTPRAPLPPRAGIRVVPGATGLFPGGSRPAAWAPDPTGRHQWRWWSGVDWTDHVADDGVAGVDRLVPE